MLYVCEKCHYEFEKAQSEEQCPDCGKRSCIRPASPEETAAFERLKLELLKEKF